MEVIIIIFALLIFIVAILGKSKKNNSTSYNENDYPYYSPKRKYSRNTDYASAPRTSLTKRKLPKLTDSFIALDVETATGARNSICQLAFIKYVNGEPQSFESYYIQPPLNKYDIRNTRVHKITQNVTADKPTFAELWPEIFSHLQGNRIVAHNAAFDINCIIQACEYYDIPIPEFDYDCTYVRTKLKLKDASKAYGVELTNHHNALSDANCCAEIYMHLFNKTKPVDPDTVPDPIKEVKRPNIAADINNPIYGKAIVFTGDFNSYSRDDITDIALSLGAKVVKGVSSNTDFLVTGLHPGPAKIEKARLYIDNGKNLKIIQESDFLVLIKPYI